MDKMNDYNAKQQHNQEFQQIEWKWSWQDGFLKWLCGYANTEAGILYRQIFIKGGNSIVSSDTGMLRNRFLY